MVKTLSGVKCPFCGNDDLDQIDMTKGVKGLYADLECKKCKEWWIVYAD